MGTAIAPQVAHDLFAQAVRVQRPGGQQRAAWNSHLRYLPLLGCTVRPTRQAGRTRSSTNSTPVMLLASPRHRQGRRVLTVEEPPPRCDGHSPETHPTHLRRGCGAFRKTTQRLRRGASEACSL
ncbi:hypothetical protein [Cellulomonas sp.]|uniref:hypothetical protein n=1 Tax=Cellulomonas sp. TaxID=40001 RepID=UPI001B0DE168|nr:hypothetical protein [Cellulomonas sp.]MBO9556747.1 hypothetical protein [Cellulomonas sp.]